MIDNKCGFISIIGRPNVGKSTLLNHLIGQKLAITSRKPQTTRKNLLGIKTIENVQMIFVDTPGIHLMKKGRNNALNIYMNKTAKQSFKEVDIIICVFDRNIITNEDKYILDIISTIQKPILIAINKIDKIENKSILLEHIKYLSQKLPNAQFIPISALKSTDLNKLEKLIINLLPNNPFIFQEDDITDQSIKFLSSEIIREKIIRSVGDEIPYNVAVEIEKFEETKTLDTIYGLIWLERSGQKRIIIGEKGEKLKQIGTEARKDIEKLLNKKVMLHLWVKVKTGWSDNNFILKSLGYK